VVTICTASLIFSNPTFCPHSVFMCFVWISEQTAIISLYNINWLVFVTEISVYCAVRAVPLNLIHVNLSYKMFSHRPYQWQTSPLAIRTLALYSLPSSVPSNPPSCPHVPLPYCTYHTSFTTSLNVQLISIHCIFWYSTKWINPFRVPLHFFIGNSEKRQNDYLV